MLGAFSRYGALAAAVLLVSLDVAAQTRPNLMFCGSSQSTGANLYSGIDALTEVFSCTPDNNTQALLVTRSGTVSGNGPAWLDYLNNGGVIITEFNNPEAVYNEIYGTAYTPDFDGNCRDNVMPSVILNPSDPFWLANPFAPVDPIDDSCGSDLRDVVDGETEVIALGERDQSGTISLAYRNQGAGVLFLSAADWQDSESEYTESSRQLFGGMISARFTPAAPPPPPEPVPSLSLWSLALLSGMLSLLGLGAVRRRTLL